MSRMRSAGRTRFQLTPDSVRGERMRRYAPQGGAAVDAVPECFSGGASAAHQRWLLCPRCCRGLTESVTAHAVGLRLWSSGVPPARRQHGRVKSRHAALRSAYRVTAECRRSATMSADVGGDGVTRPLARSDSGTAARGGDGGGETAPLRCVLIWWREAG